jgi:hypothetical protein
MVKDTLGANATKAMTLRFVNSDVIDSDGDGVNNYREMYDGTNPFDAKSFNSLSIGLVAHYPFEGWIAVSECGVDWVADSTKVSKLSSILGNEDAAKVIHSSFRHPLVDYFEKKNYLDNWVIYGVDSKEKIKPLLINDFGNSTRDCNNNKQSELVAILKNKNNNSKKLIIISLYGSDNYEVIYDNEIDSDVSGFRKLSSTEKSQLNYDYDIWYTNPLMMVWNDYRTTVIGLNPYNNSVGFQQLYGYD